MPTITEESLEFAQKHVKCFYASDFFPDPDEFSAVWAGWDVVLDYYKTADIKQVGTTPEEMACAKAIGGYRIVHQLQPLDVLTYTALASIIAPHLESARLAEQEGIACSYRIAIDKKGRFFKPDTDGYSIYRRRSVDLAATHQWVLTADISGFYNHIYVHRIEGAVHDLGRELRQIAADLHEFLLNLNDRVSIGIPVGPAASIVIAELILNDIDQFLREHYRRPTYTRYVDDFRFFSNSKLELEEIWHDLSLYLFRAQRLTLANAKCRIMPSSVFVDEILSPPENEGRARFAKALGISFDDLSEFYGHREAGSPPDQQTTDTKREALEGLFAQLLVDRELNIGLARQLLRRAKTLRMRCIAPPLLDNLEKLAPVIRDVGLYLNSVMSGKAVVRHGDRLERFFQANSQFITSSHLHYWIAWILSGKPAAAEITGCSSFIGSALPRFRARMARALDRPGWVRNNRSEWQRWAAWDRWSLLHAAEVLAERERGAWMESVSRSADVMDRLVAAKVRAL